MMLMQVCPVCGKKGGYFTDSKCKFCGGTAVNTTTTSEEYCNEMGWREAIEWEHQTDRDYVLNSPEYNEVLFKKREEFDKKYNAGELPSSYYAEATERYRKANGITRPKCPTCGSENISPISGLERGASILGLGIFSKKINKTYKCNSCRATW